MSGAGSLSSSRVCSSQARTYPPPERCHSTEPSPVGVLLRPGSTGQRAPATLPGRGDPAATATGLMRWPRARQVSIHRRLISTLLRKPLSMPLMCHLYPNVTSYDCLRQICHWPPLRRRPDVTAEMGAAGPRCPTHAANRSRRPMSLAIRPRREAEPRAKRSDDASRWSIGLSRGTGRGTGRGTDCQTTTPGCQRHGRVRTSR
jgi:hypothetical protein